MSGPKPHRPPPVRAATAALTPQITETDLADLARGAGLELVESVKPRSALAHEVTEALRHYALCHRMDHAAAGAGEVRRWASALHLWAAEGLVLLGGTLDNDSKAEEFPLPHSVTAMRLADAWPAFDTPSNLEYLLHKATGHNAFPEDHGERRPGLHDSVHCSAAALEVFHILAASLEKRAASEPRETRPTEYARRDLVRSLGEAYRDLHGREPKFSRSAGHATKQGERNILASGPVLDWLRGLLNMVSERSDDPVMAALADWGRRPEAMPGLLRKIFGNTPEEIP